MNRKGKRTSVWKVRSDPWVTVVGWGKVFYRLWLQSKSWWRHHTFLDLPPCHNYDIIRRRVMELKIWLDSLVWLLSTWRTRFDTLSRIWIKYCHVHLPHVDNYWTAGWNLPGEELETWHHYITPRKEYARASSFCCRKWNSRDDPLCDLRG